MNSNHLHYSGCQKNVPFDKRFFVTTTYAPSFIAEHFYGKGYIRESGIKRRAQSTEAHARLFIPF